ncbi:MAG: hypothetical protein ACOYXR_03695 [Nitrospirota bacterium]
MLKTTRDEHDEIERELALADREQEHAADRYQRWDRGFLLKNLWKTRFAQLKNDADTATAKQAELQEQLRLTTLATEFDIPSEQAEPYYRMRDTFATLAESQQIWDTLTKRPTNAIVERSLAKEAITREPVTFRLGRSELISWDQQVPHLANRNGGDLWIYPGFILYRVSKEAFALIDTRDVVLTYTPVQFIEHEHVPSDSRVIEHTWAKTNKDGSPDRRFKDNYQIPVTVYGALVFKSSSGLHEEYQVSNVGRTEQFAEAWMSFRNSFVPLN